MKTGTPAALIRAPSTWWNDNVIFLILQCPSNFVPVEVRQTGIVKGLHYNLPVWQSSRQMLFRRRDRWPASL